MDLSIIGKASKPYTFAYTWKDLALYALGIGAKKDELEYLYEGKGPKAYPTFAVVPNFIPMIDLLNAAKINFAMVVYGGERVNVVRPFAPQGTLTTVATIRGIYDLRKFASVTVDTETKDEAGQVIATNVSTIIVREAGGFGGELPPREEAAVVAPKDRAPDFRVEEQTSHEQALLYRLSGDTNPLHADPEMAKSVGFEKGPILHGLATLGFAARHLTRGHLAGDASRIKVFEGRFSKPVWPGDTLVTEGYVVGDKVALQVSVKERSEQVLSRAWAQIS